jgi:hypothetical protein
VLFDQLSGDEKRSGVVDAIHAALLASIRFRFHQVD